MLAGNLQSDRSLDLALPLFWAHVHPEAGPGADQTEAIPVLAVWPGVGPRPRGPVIRDLSAGALVELPRFPDEPECVFLGHLVGIAVTPVIGADLVKDSDGHLIESVYAGRPDQSQPQLAMVVDAIDSPGSGDLELTSELGVPALCICRARSFRPTGRCLPCPAAPP